MGVGNAMQIGLSGLGASGSAISVRAGNIVNQQSDGYRATDVYFSTLVTSTGNNLNFGGNGVRSVTRTRTTGGDLTATGIDTDLAIAKGNGFFVVNDKEDGSGNILFTRAGSYRQDANGILVNTAGYTLMGWPLDAQGRLPGEAGNLNTVPSSLIDSLKPVNLSAIGAAAAATSKIDFEAQLDSRAKVKQGSGETINFPVSNPINHNMSATHIIAPTTSLTEGEDIVVTVPSGSFAFTYGGYSRSSNIQTPPGIFGVTQQSAQFSGLTNGDTFTITTSSGNKATFTYLPSGGNSSQGQFNTLDSLAASINETFSEVGPVKNASALYAKVVGGRLYVSPLIGNDGMTFTDVTGTIASSLGFYNTATAGSGVNRFTTMDNLNTETKATGLLDTVRVDTTNAASLNIYNKNPLQGITFGGRQAKISSQFNASDVVTSSPITVATPILGATTVTSAFSGATTGQSFSIKLGSTGATNVYTYNALLGAGQFSTLTNLATRINATTGLSASVVGTKLVITPTSTTLGDALTFTDVTGTFAASLGLTTSTVNKLGATTVNGVFDGATNGDGIIIGDGTNSITMTYTTGVPSAAGGTFNSLSTLQAAIDADANFISYIEGNRMFVKPKASGTGITFANTGGGATDFLTPLGLASVAGTTNILDELNIAGQTLGPAYDPNNVAAPNMASGNVVPSYAAAFEIFDALGTLHSFIVDFLKVGTNEWAVEIIANPPGDVVLAGNAAITGLIASGNVSFNGDATLQSVSGGIATPLSISWANQAINSVISLNWGTEGVSSTTPGTAQKGGTDGLSQYAQKGSANIKPDGVPAAGQSGISVDLNGYITVQFENGLSRKVYKLPLAAFPNPAGLSQEDGNVYQSSDQAGSLNLQAAGSSGIGIIRAAYLEKSNVDLAEELTSLVVAQRNYEASMQTISVSNELLKELGRLFA